LLVEDIEEVAVCGIPGRTAHELFVAAFIPAHDRPDLGDRCPASGTRHTLALRSDESGHCHVVQDAMRTTGADEKPRTTVRAAKLI